MILENSPDSFRPIFTKLLPVSIPRILHVLVQRNYDSHDTKVCGLEGKGAMYLSVLGVLTHGSVFTLDCFTAPRI